MRRSSKPVRPGCGPVRSRDRSTCLPSSTPSRAHRSGTRTRLSVGLFVVILLSSVHLAYHYAVDGYVSIALVSGIWLTCRWIARTIAPAEPRTQSAARGV